MSELEASQLCRRLSLIVSKSTKSQNEKDEWFVEIGEGDCEQDNARECHDIALECVQCVKNKQTETELRELIRKVHNLLVMRAEQGLRKAKEEVEEENVSESVQHNAGFYFQNLKQLYELDRKHAITTDDVEYHNDTLLEYEMFDWSDEQQNSCKRRKLVTMDNDVVSKLHARSTDDPNLQMRSEATGTPENPIEL